MLSLHDVETLAFYEQWGDVYCVPCAWVKWTPLACEKADRGLTTAHDIHPLSRYELLSEAMEIGVQVGDGGEDVEQIEDRLVRFAMEHPQLAPVLGEEDSEGQFQVPGGIVARFAFWRGRERCVECGKPLVGLFDFGGSEKKPRAEAAA